MDSNTSVVQESALPNKYLFFFDEYNVPGYINYSVFPISATGCVSLGRAVEVAVEYARKGFRIVVDKNTIGNYFPLPRDDREKMIGELNDLVIVDILENELNPKRFVRVEHPGVEHIEKILATIPK